MKRPRIGFKYREAADAISRDMGIHPPPLIRIGRGRITIRFRQLGASSWPETRRIEHAFEVAAFARSLLAGDLRRALRRRASRAVVVIYEDATLANGCDIDSRWECVIPASADQFR